jgi:hypothetical protein
MLQSKLRQIGTAFASLTQNCYHYYRPVKDMPCIIWAETGENNSFHSDNQKSEQRIVGTVDCFTKSEFDPLLDDIQQTFADLGLTWTLDAVQYETETKLIHYTWSWGVIADGETETSGS